MKKISREVGVSFSKTFGVATFYAQFHLKPRGRNIIRVCQGTACHVRGGAKVLEAVKDFTGVEINESTQDLRFTLETVACIGACGLAPVMSVNEDTHGKLKPEQAVSILEKYN
jgi:NADH-quinone oxidoreductase subunit E